MAIILLGKSKCSICKHALHESDEILMFAHFVPPNHHLWKYSDSGMHEDCFNKWKYKEEFLELYKSVSGRNYQE